MHSSTILQVASLAVAAALIGTHTPASGALITFSGLNNGINTTADPDQTTTSAAIPTGYQPLQNAYPAPGGNTDGANLGVGITWVGCVAATVTNSAVNEHTHQVTASDTAKVNLYDGNSSSVISMTFDQPVTMPSFYWAFISPGNTQTATFSGYTNASDSTPAVTFQATYTPSTGDSWQLATGFGATPFQKVTFSRNSGHLQLDDITVNATPEPASLALAGFASLALLLRRRRTRLASQG